MTLASFSPFCAIGRNQRGRGSALAPLLPAPASYWLPGFSQHESYKLAKAQQKDDNGVWFKLVTRETS